MKQDKDLLLRYLSMAIPYNVKILHNDWDYDRDCDFSSVETLIGIDDRFIYTLKGGEKDEHSIIEPLSVLDYKPYLRPMSSMTEQELEELNCLCYHHISVQDDVLCGHICYVEITDVQDFLLRYHFDFMGLIPKGLAIEVTKENDTYTKTEVQS